MLDEELGVIGDGFLVVGCEDVLEGHADHGRAKKWPGISVALIGAGPRDSGAAKMHN
jgi:NADPH-dependent glutamate synthase beta subunit-like oxidoreductase